MDSKTLQWMGSVAIVGAITACSNESAVETQEPPIASDEAASDSGHYFDAAGVQIHYTDEGQGEPVVLIHGFAMDLTRWQSAGVTDVLLGNGHRVIAIDARGHAKSEGPHEPDAYGDEIAKDVVRLLDHLGLERAHVVGYSMGALVSNKLRELAPERLKSLTLGGAGWMKKGDPALADVSGTDIAESLERTGDFKWMLRTFTEGRTPPATDEEIDSRNEAMLEGNDPLALAAVLRAWDGFAVSEESLRNNTVPTLSVVGENDPLKVQVDELQSVMANLEVVVIPEATHGALTDPMFVETVARFIQEHSGT